VDHHCPQHLGGIVGDSGNGKIKNTELTSLVSGTRSACCVSAGAAFRALKVRTPRSHVSYQWGSCHAAGGSRVMAFFGSRIEHSSQESAEARLLNAR
jgi:hypothetical protein